MDVCRNAAPHVVPCVLWQSSWNNDTHSFRTKEAQENQSGMFRAKLVIFAQEGHRDMVRAKINHPKRARVSLTLATTCGPAGGSSASAHALALRS
jgi:hypothetical protein